jgi:hypothetical protein
LPGYEAHLNESSEVAVFIAPGWHEAADKLNSTAERLGPDRFLARIVAVLGDAAMLKGGLVLELRLERARTTKDVDLRMAGLPEDVLAKLQEAGRMDLVGGAPLKACSRPHGVLTQAKQTDAAELCHAI